MSATHEHSAQAWLELILAPGISLTAKLAWLRAFGSPGAVLEQPVAKLKEISKEARSLRGLADSAVVGSVLNWIRSSGGSYAALGDDAYPPAVAEHLAEPPLAVFMRGNHDLLAQPSLALVGGPDPTQPAAHRAATFAYELAREGWLIAAGLSAGIGSAALRGSQTHSQPLAVIGAPAAWQGLRLGEEIAAGGLLISEYPPGARAPAGSYSARHRLLACFAEAFVFIEAERRCGSMGLAALAGDLGREVMAVPADPSNEAGRGCNRLIGEGARLVESSTDVLAAVRGR